MSVVLMYHALYADDEVSEIDVEDQPYAVSVSTFKAHLESLKNYSVGLLPDDPSADLPEVVITFDDGHISNHSLALPLLQQANYPAYFFVTSDFIENRAHFCRPEQLRDLIDAGMVVGSHGKSHSFLGDLSDKDAKFELVHSRETLQAMTGDKITTISYPGGRYSAQTMRLAQDAGYRQIFDSSFDVVSATDLALNKALSRVAIRKSTSMEEFQSMIAHDTTYYRQVQRTQWLKQTVKKALGNRLYHGLYKSLSTRKS